MVSAVACGLVPSLTLDTTCLDGLEGEDVRRELLEDVGARLGRHDLGELLQVVVLAFVSRQVHEPMVDVVVDAWKLLEEVPIVEEGWDGKHRHRVGPATSRRQSWAEAGQLAQAWEGVMRDSVMVNDVTDGSLAGRKDGDG